jgi:hypothetical protein
MKKLGLLIIVSFLVTAVYADVIYDDQTFDWGATWNGFSIYAGNGYETADDFETAEDWTLETICFWELWSSQHNIRVHIFSDSAGAPGSVLYQEEVTATDITWTIAYQDFDYTVYRGDIPINGFNIANGTRYWVGLQSTSDNPGCNWLVMGNDPAWWSNCYFYDGGWFDSYDYFGEASACEFELHGSPPDAAVEPVSLGTIKAGFAE